MSAGAFDLQGHRGTRGLAPENTLAAFRIAVALGVTTLETDLADHQGRCSWSSATTRCSIPTWCADPTENGSAPPCRSTRSPWPSSSATTSAGSIRRAKYAQQFPEQKPVDGERFPTLAELFATAGPDVRFNIEIKTDPTKPDLTVDPNRFAQLAVDAIRLGKAGGRSTIQSFDWRGLIEARRLAPEIATSCLSIESSGMDTVDRASGRPSPWLAGLDLAAYGGSVPRLAKAAGCAVWSPFWRNVTPENIKQAQALGLKVLPWTVNNPAEMAQLIDMGVDGLITDYPDRAQPVLAAKGLKSR